MKTICQQESWQERWQVECAVRLSHMNMCTNAECECLPMWAMCIGRRRLRRRVRNRNQIKTIIPQLHIPNTQRNTTEEHIARNNTACAGMCVCCHLSGSSRSILPCNQTCTHRDDFFRKSSTCSLIKSACERHAWIENPPADCYPVVTVVQCFVRPLVFMFLNLCIFGVNDRKYSSRAENSVWKMIYCKLQSLWPIFTLNIQQVFLEFVYAKSHAVFLSKKFHGI